MNAVDCSGERVRVSREIPRSAGLAVAPETGRNSLVV
jgi:hypothetical protein